MRVGMLGSVVLGLPPYTLVSLIQKVERTGGAPVRLDIGPVARPESDPVLP
jgi:hypothetical protein